ncbi:hypothetical protein GCM10011399_02300 [Subtercola lobariae]|uniref:YncE family protein n=1 Tax=Subtercola lobariae TaxID=1588641 RepID=A0A917EVN0_9MICO|nr:hypothetical protein GCM10011399_02300 [Subtercola lobariae]
MLALILFAVPHTARAEGDGESTHTAARITLPVGMSSMATGVASDPKAHILYTADHDQVLAVNELTGVITVFGLGLGGPVDAVAVDPDYDEVFATQTDEYGNTWVHVFAGSAHSNIATIPVPGGASALAVDHRTHTLVAVGYGSGGTGSAGTLTFINEDTNSVSSTLAIGRDPEAVAIDQFARVAYATSQVDNSVWVIDLDGRAVKSVVAVGGAPAGVAVDQVSHEAFVTNWADDSVSVITSIHSPLGEDPVYSVAETIGVPDQPWGVAVDSSTQLVYVAPEGAHAVTMINERSGAISESVGPVDGNPWFVAVDETLHAAFVTSRSGTAIVVVSTAPELAPSPTCTLSWC